MNCPVNCFLFHQILTSVLPIRVRVMKTLIAPTVMVLIAVLVSKDLLEMEHLVMVGKFPKKIS